MQGLLMTLILGIFILVGTVVSLIKKENEDFVTFSIGIAFGVMFMLVIFDLLPEVIEIFFSSFKWYIALLFIILLVFLGLIFLKVLDRFIPDHDHKDNHEEDHLHHIGVISCVFLALHNIIEGMAIYSVFTSNFKSGLFLAIGVGLHNIPLGMVIASMFYNYNKSKFKTILISLFISITTFIGGIIMYLLSNFISEIVLGVLLCITLGMTLYIMIFELFTHIKNEGNKKISVIGILSGVIVVLVSLLFH